MKQPSFASYFTSAIGILLSLLLFAIIVSMGNKSDEADPVNAAVAKERTKTLNALKAEAQQNADNYSVIDPTKGVVRIPIEEAMKLTVEKLGSK